MEIRTVKITTTHDLRPIIELLDQIKESVPTVMLLIGIGASRSVELAAREDDIVAAMHAASIADIVKNICEKWGFTNGKS